MTVGKLSENNSIACIYPPFENQKLSTPLAVYCLVAAFIPTTSSGPIEVSRENLLRATQVSWKIK